MLENETQKTPGERASLASLKKETLHKNWKGGGMHLLTVKRVVVPVGQISQTPGSSLALWPFKCLAIVISLYLFTWVCYYFI